MKFHDYNEKLGLSLVTDDGSNGWRYEPIKPPAGAPLEATPQVYLRQGHYCANVIAQGLVIAGRRIDIVPADWKRKAGRELFA